MRKCKVRSCNRKHVSRGYCKFHYDRKKNGIPFTRRCIWCKEILFIGRWKHCSTSCGGKFRYHILGRREKYLKERKEKYVYIPTFSGSRKGQRNQIYVGKVTEEMKLKIRKIREKVLKECIKNPRKYLK